MTQFPPASPIRCACCHSGKNALFLHGPCDPMGQILAAKYQVTCGACGASGPLSESAALALEGWRLMSCPSRGRLRERAKSYAKALANDILR